MTLDAIKNAVAEAREALAYYEGAEYLELFRIGRVVYPEVARNLAAKKLAALVAELPEEAL